MNLPLLLILVGAALVRLPYISDPFTRAEEWGMAQFSVYASNYHRYGYLESGLFPIYGKVGDTFFPYANHPPLASIMLGLWTGLFGNSEAAARWLSILFALGSIYAIYILGRLAFQEKVGLWAAAIYAFMPLSVYMGHFYTMEIPQTTFTLLALIFILRWDQRGDARSFLAALLLLILGNQCDIYPVFMSPALGLWGLYDLYQRRDPKRFAGWLALTLIGTLCWIFQILYLKPFGWDRAMLVSGTSKYLTPWNFWFDPAYYQSVGTRLFHYSAWLPLIGAVVALKAARGWNRSQRLLMACLISIPVLDFLIVSLAVQDHNYRVMHFFPLIAMLCATLIAEWRWQVLAGCSVLFAGLAVWKTLPFYEVLRPKEPSIGLQIRKHTTDRDILVGLPPALAFYVDRPAVVPYYYLWRHTSLYDDPQKLYAELRPLAQEEGYERIILFTQFLLPRRITNIEWSSTFDGLPNLRRKTQPGDEPQVWEFVEPDGEEER